MAGSAIGLIETNGIVAMIVGADAALKVADVRLLGYQIVRQGLVTVLIAGDVDAVEEAVSTGVREAKQVGRVYRHLVLPRPDDEVRQMLKKRRSYAGPSPPVLEKPQVSQSEGEPVLTNLQQSDVDSLKKSSGLITSIPQPSGTLYTDVKVAELRRMARELGQSQYTKSQISKLNRKLLIKLLEQHAGREES